MNMKKFILKPMCVSEYVCVFLCVRPSAWKDKKSYSVFLCNYHSEKIKLSTMKRYDMQNFVAQNIWRKILFDCYQPKINNVDLKEY